MLIYVIIMVEIAHSDQSQTISTRNGRRILKPDVGEIKT